MRRAGWTIVAGALTLASYWWLRAANRYLRYENPVRRNARARSGRIKSFRDGRLVAE